jgi:hypothetical protein
MKSPLIIILTVMFVLPTIVDAKILEVMSCRGGRVEIGDTTYSVLKKCGEPAYQEIISADGCEKRERWHYDCKNRGYIDLLEFKSGILVDRSRGEDSRGVQDCK